MSYAATWKQECLDHNLLTQLLDYNIDTGFFTWKKDRTRGVKSGDVAGSVGGSYLQVSVLGVRYLAHRLAWFYVHKVWPPDLIDHINRDKLDNSMSNLRIASFCQNAQNRGASRINKTGLKGVTFHKRDKKYQAAITENREVKHLGYFDTPEAAHAAYVKASIETQTHSAFSKAKNVI